MKPIYITHFSESTPRFCWPQQKLNQYLASVISKHQENNRDWNTLIERFGADPSQISQRHTDVVDIQKEIHFEKSVTKKSMTFQELAHKHIHNLYENEISHPDHLLHVTCTGYVAPSAAQTLIAQKNWNTQVTHLYHMGCYAAMPALRTAQALSYTQTTIDIVHNEICSLHLNPFETSPEQLVIQSLFSDGHIRYRISNCADEKTKNLRFIQVKEAIIPQSHHLMSWSIGDHAMDMTLSREVPQTILLNIEAIVDQWKKDFPEIDHEKTIYAIHPGGPKIIDLIAEKLKLRQDQYQHSKKVLLDRGNMSSATLPHIWKDVLHSENTGTPILSFAFGPGLTVFSSLMWVD